MQNRIIRTFHWRPEPLSRGVYQVTLAVMLFAAVITLAVPLYTDDPQRIAWSYATFFLMILPMSLLVYTRKEVGLTMSLRYWLSDEFDLEVTEHQAKSLRRQGIVEVGDQGTLNAIRYKREFILSHQGRTD